MKEQALSLFHIIDWYPWTKYQCLSFLRRCFVFTIPYYFYFNKNLFIHLFIQQIFTEHLTVPCAVLSRFSCVWLCVTPWTIAHQAPLSKGFSRQEYWSGLPFPTPGNLPDWGIEHSSPTQAGSLPLAPPGKPYTMDMKRFIKRCEWP